MKLCNFNILLLWLSIACYTTKHSDSGLSSYWILVFLWNIPENSTVQNAGILSDLGPKIMVGDIFMKK